MQAVLAVPALACALALPLASQQVYVVDHAGGPGVFFDVQNALNAGAGDGDVILVRAGDYGPFAIEGQGVTIVADAGATPRFIGDFGAATGYTAFPISGLGAGDALVLRGLAFERTQALEQLDPLMAVGAGGTVWIEDCSLALGSPSLLVGAGAKVVLERSTVAGLAGFFTGVSGMGASTGLVVEGEATLQGSSVQGGRGYNGYFDFPSIMPTPGADAVRVTGAGALSALDTLLQGGGGGDGFSDFSCHPPATGGPGLHLVSGAARLFGGTQAGGPPGAPAAGCPAGSAGPGLLQEGGSVGALAGPAPALAVGALAREGETLSGAVTGEPGALAFLALDDDPVALYLAPLSGTLLVGAPAILALGAIPESGTLPLSAPVGELGAGVSALQLTLQAAACGSGGCALGAGSHAVLLDGAF